MIPEEAVSTGIAQLTERYRVGPDEALPNIDCLLRVLLGRWQSIENALAVLQTQLVLETSTGVWLDQIWGRFYGLRRQPGWSDDTYRFFLRTKSFALRSDGKPDHLIRLMHRFTPEGTPISEVLYDRLSPMVIRMRLPFLWSSAALAIELLSIDAVMAGVYVVLELYDPHLTGGWDSVEGGVLYPGAFGSVTGDAYALSMFSHAKET